MSWYHTPNKTQVHLRKGADNLAIEYLKVHLRKRGDNLAIEYLKPEKEYIYAQCQAHGNMQT